MFPRNFCHTPPGVPLHLSPPRPRPLSFALPIIQVPHPQPRHRNNKTGNGKARGAKGDRSMQRGRSVYQVLCVNTEPCANAGGEVRGDLHHGVPVASVLSPQAYEDLPEVVVEVVGGGGVGD